MLGTGEYLPKIIVLPLARTSSYLGAVLNLRISCLPFSRWVGNRSAEFSIFIFEVYNYLTLIPVNYNTSIYYIFFFSFNSWRWQHCYFGLVLSRARTGTPGRGDGPLVA